MGLAALHIARGEGFPVWFYGQQYMGTLEAYLAAPVFALAGGPSLLGLRLPTLALYALFLLLAWRLTLRLTGDRWFGLLMVALLALGSDRIVKNQLIAGGGYPEMNAAGVALALLAVDLASGRPGCDAGRPDGRTADTGLPGRRLARWAAWGFLAGLMLWVDPLVLPYVAATGAVLVGFCRRELWGAGRGAARGGGRAGGGPAAAAQPADTGATRCTPCSPPAVRTPARAGPDRLHGGLVLGPPLGMGFCAPGQCATWQLWWALALPLLLAIAAATAWRSPAHPRPQAAAGLCRCRLRRGVASGGGGGTAGARAGRGGHPRRVHGEQFRRAHPGGEFPLPVLPARLPARAALAGVDGGAARAAPVGDRPARRRVDAGPVGRRGVARRHAGHRRPTPPGGQRGPSRRPGPPRPGTPSWSTPCDSWAYGTCAPATGPATGSPSPARSRWSARSSTTPCAPVSTAIPAYRREVDSAAAPAWVAPAGSPAGGGARRAAAGHARAASTWSPSRAGASTCRA